MEAAVKGADHVHPAFLAFGDLVELLLDERREIIVHDIAELRVQIVGHDHSYIGGRQLVLFPADVLGKRFARDGALLQSQLHVLPLDALPVLLDHVSPGDDRRDRRGIGRRPADAELLEPLDERCLAVAGRTLRETLRSRNAPSLRSVAFLQRRQQSLLAVGGFVFGRFGIESQETVEQDHLAGRDESLLGSVDRDVDYGPLGLGRSHLRGDRPFPDQVVQPFLGRRTFDVGPVHVGRTDRLVGLLSPFRLGLIVARLGIPFPEQLHDLGFRRGDRLRREVHRVGTHVGNISGFV